MADAKPHVEIREYESAFELLEDLKREGITGDEKKKIFDKYIFMQAQMRRIPVNVGFELTPLCNFDCKMCYVHLTKAQVGKEGNILSTEQWLDIMKQAVDAGMLHADLTGGECLTHPGFKKLYTYLKSQAVKVAILTNGQLLTEEIVDFLALDPPEIVQITVYGSDDDAYENVTGRRAFTEVRQAVERLKERKIKTVLTITPSRYTQKDIHTLLEVVRGMGIQYSVGDMSLPAREDTGRAIEDFIPEVDLCARLRMDEQSYRKKNYSTFEKHPIVKIDRIPKGYKADEGIPCASGRRACHINWKGEMQPCIPFHTITRSVLEHGYVVAWEWIRDTMRGWKPPQKCSSCKLQAKCTTCAAEKTSGVLNGPVNQAVCQRYTRYLEAGIITVADENGCV